MIAFASTNYLFKADQAVRSAANRWVGEQKKRFFRVHPPYPHSRHSLPLVKRLQIQTPMNRRV